MALSTDRLIAHRDRATGRVTKDMPDGCAILQTIPRYKHLVSREVQSDESTLATTRRSAMYPKRRYARLRKTMQYHNILDLALGVPGANDATRMTPGVGLSTMAHTDFREKAFPEDG